MCFVLTFGYCLLTYSLVFQIVDESSYGSSEVFEPKDDMEFSSEDDDLLKEVDPKFQKGKKTRQVQPVEEKKERQRRSRKDAREDKNEEVELRDIDTVREQDSRKAIKKKTKAKKPRRRFGRKQFRNLKSCKICGFTTRDHLARHIVRWHNLKSETAKQLAKEAAKKVLREPPPLLRSVIEPSESRSHL